MKLSTSVCPLLLAAALCGCSGDDGPSEPAPTVDAGVPAAPLTQEVLDRMARDIELRYELLETHGAQAGVDCKALAGDYASCHTARLVLSNRGEEALPSGGWTLYFHSIRRVLSVEGEDFTISHINGDLHALRPTASFAGFAAGEALNVAFVAEYWTLYQSDFMPRYYLSADGLDSRIIANTDSDDSDAYAAPITGENRKRTPQDNNVFATAQTRYDDNASLTLLAAEEVARTVIPTPVSQEHPEAGALDLSVGVDIAASEALSQASVDALAQRLSLLGVERADGGVSVSVSVDAAHFEGEDAAYASAGGYELRVGPADGGGGDDIEIIGYDQAGAFYGVQSLMALLPAGGDGGDGALSVPHALIKDAPRFAHRGVLVDVARNFRSKQVLLRFIEQMAAYKLNRLHLHLSDDEGWRLAIDGLPELTEVGGRRCHDLDERRCLLPQLGSGPFDDNAGSGFYSRADYIDIVRHAQAHFVQVIPEIDMPAHARAAIVAMEARYELLAASDQDAAAEYRLRDPDDTSNYTSVQFYDDSYLNPCQPSTYRFADKVIGEVQAMHLEAGQPLAAWHMGGDEAKNIHLGGGYEGLGGTTEWKGSIDQSAEDLPWAKSPRCQQLLADQPAIGGVGDLGAYFARRMGEIVAAREIATLVAWQDGLKGIDSAGELAVAEVMINFWETLYWGGFESVHAWLESGFSVVLSNPDYLYFDFPYEVDPAERGYYWAARAIDAKKVFTFSPGNLAQNAETSRDRDGNPFAATTAVAEAAFTGIQGQLWGETIRSDAHFEYMAFPRLLALAERAWHRASWELERDVGQSFEAGVSEHVDTAALAFDWNRFANALGQKELAKLDAAGVAYRVPVPGATLVEGKLSANVEFPGLRIQYRDAAGSWQLYDAEAQPAASASTELRALATDERAGRAVTVAP
ncbi:family 20 glycosylhydrolase [Haliangium ochraceum]|uniref:beta-N-acetylhexosaminidase n=1 Tax=Haliangium ochraceum (strain DSM 14365 / JCM 11303 / SMP-2) TaxID=502025 RepID=D0LVP4_HALO1|nr:family 20 glycosylhydrolase [Haliangium ochraceum]ACY14028.1 Beta-N-acetylhexosaminidase [Haliangium ochraceum DSM 14365]